MSPSLKCKKAGLKGLIEMSEISSASTRTLSNWFHDKPVLFECVLCGCVAIKSKIALTDEEQGIQELIARVVTQVVSEMKGREL